MPTIHYPRPTIALTDAARLLHERYPAAGRLAATTEDGDDELARAIAELPGERDLNLRITTDAGRFVLKIAQRDENAAELAMQNAALAHLAEREPRLGLQRVVPCATGESVTTFTAADGSTHLVRLLTYLPGTLWARTRPHSSGLLASLGETVARLDRGLADFDHPAARRDLKWDALQAGWIANFVEHVEVGPRRERVAACLERFERHLLPALRALPRGVIYNDANDHNLLVRDQRVAGVIDFGDLCHSVVLADPAVAAAYALMGLADPLAGLCALVAGYHSILALRPEELELLPALVELRLVVSVTNSAVQRTLEPDNAYLQVSDAPAWALLDRLAATPPALVVYALRTACGFPAHPCGPRLRAFLDGHRDDFAPLVAPDLATAPLVRADWSVASTELGSLDDMADVPRTTARLWERMRAAGAAAAIGSYDEARPVYRSDAFRVAGNDGDEWRTVHLGLDVFLDPGTPVFAPLAGVVHSFADNAAPGDYGPCIVLAHEIDDGRGADDPLRFFTLYGHLSADSLDGLAVGRRFAAGERVARIGDYPGNGNWPPHLHFQIVLDMLGNHGDFIGACRPGERSLWLALCPDPLALARVPDALRPRRPAPAADLLRRRRERLGRNLSVSYRRPLHIVRGWRQWLFDADGQRYLDAYNNVPHVGHCHPHVVRRTAEQLALLNTNTRYLQDGILRYAERLTATLPEPLRVCFFTASGSEANELALRLVRTKTGRRDMIVMAGAYHGHTSSLIDLSPYKHDGPGGAGAPEWVHTAPLPDIYRGAHRGADAGSRYAADVRAVLAEVAAHGRGVAGFLAETFPSVGGQIVPPEGYFPAAYQAVRAAGGLCIADEVQTGFGRTGDTFWAFERYGVIPDVVVLGKPIANGYPMGAVVTTPEIAAAFDNGMEFFSTFGGSSAAIAAADATLDVLASEDLQENARRVGERMLAGLRALATRHEIVGDVRGAGLFLGVELVRDRSTRTPAPIQASYVAERLRDFGVLLGTDGPFHNVIKIRPPLCFTAADGDALLERLDRALGENAARPNADAE